MTNVWPLIQNREQSAKTSCRQECASDAERFCIEHFAWLNQTAKLTALKRGLLGYEEDIAHEVFKKLRSVTNEAWSRMKYKKAYVARAIINCANDLTYIDHGSEPLTDNILTSTPAEAMEAAILVSELYHQLSSSEQDLLELIFQQFSGEEIASELNVSHSTVRKRISRLKRKLCALNEISTDLSAKTNFVKTKGLASARRDR